MNDSDESAAEESAVARGDEVVVFLRRCRSAGPGYPDVEQVQRNWLASVAAVRRMLRGLSHEALVEALLPLILLSDGPSPCRLGTWLEFLRQQGDLSAAEIAVLEAAANGLGRRTRA